MQVVPRLSVQPPISITTNRPQLVEERERRVEQPLTPVKVESSQGVWESAKFGIRDFIDMINPLQHIPVISTIYRKLTGDEIGDASRIVGGAIFGGLTGSWISGLASAVTNVFVSRSTGRDVADHVIAAADIKPSIPQRPASVRLHATSHTDQPVATLQFPSSSGLQQAVLESPSKAQSVTETDGMAKQYNHHAHLNHSVSDVAAERAAPYLSAALDRYRQQTVVDKVSQDTDYWV